MTADVGLLRTLYHGQSLADLGDSLAAQLAELEREFTEDRADQAIRNLHGASTRVRQLVTASRRGDA